MNTFRTNTDAYDIGMTDYRGGIGFYDCPFVSPVSSPDDAARWMAGWMFARQQSKANARLLAENPIRDLEEEIKRLLGEDNETN